MKIHLNSTPNKNKMCGIDAQKWTLACICYAMGRIRVVGSMRIICVQKLCILCTPTNFVSYACKNCVSYARQRISYHMHAKTMYYMHTKHLHIICTPKSIFAYQYHEFLFLCGILFIRIFMRPGSTSLVLKDSHSYDAWEDNTFWPI